MKKQLFLLAIAVSVAASAQAQLALRPYIGVNAHKLTKDFEDAAWKSSLGYQLGIDLQIGTKFYVQPGIQFEFTKNSIVPDLEEMEIDFKRTHLRIPVMVGYAFGGVGSTFSARIFTGPNASILLSSETGEGIFDINKEDLKNAVFGWNVGAGLDFSIVFIDAGYQFGLSEVFKNFENGSKDHFYYANAGLRIRF